MGAKKETKILLDMLTSGVKAYTSGYRWLMIKTIYINHAQITVIY